tara:strand:+ start:1623 stop:1922 length:300 start_codon:yes stop_codon:yes gene_type:complete
MNIEIDILPNQIKTLMPCHIIDVREDVELKKEVLKINYEHIPMNKVLNFPDHLKNTNNLVFVCAVGVRSRIVAEAFRNKGYLNVYSVLGGVSAINDLDF